MSDYPTGYRCNLCGEEYWSANESEFTREYKCEYYSLKAHPRSCFFCDNCTDIFFDYTNGPYMFMCVKQADTGAGLLGKCNQFIEVVDE